MKDNVGKACEDAVVQAVDFLEKQLEKIQWEGSVVKAGDKIIINRGSREGVAEEDIFVVGSSDAITDPDTGEVLDNEMKPAGKIKAVTVKEKVSYCETIECAGKIMASMSVWPEK